MWEQEIKEKSHLIMKVIPFVIFFFSQELKKNLASLIQNDAPRYRLNTYLYSYRTGCRFLWGWGGGT